MLHGLVPVRYRLHPLVYVSFVCRELSCYRGVWDMLHGLASKPQTSKGIYIWVYIYIHVCICVYMCVCVPDSTSL